MRRGIRAGVVVVVALTAAVAGIAIATKSGAGGIKPYTLQETLPQMVSDFGPKTRVVQISVSSQNVDYQVIPADGRLHIRNYDIVSFEESAGVTGYNRKVANVVRAPSAAQSAEAHVTLGQVDPGVADSLLSRVGFSRGDSSATLNGAQWTLESYQGTDYVAAYDGTGVHQLNAAAAASAPGTGTCTVAQTRTQTVPATTTTVSSFSTTFTVTRNPKASKLLHCIVNAQGDVTKVLKCQQRFPP
jgi:hypothetical protein